MIAVDTSAIMSIILNEAEADTCARVLAAEAEIVISAGTLAELMIVALRGNRTEEASALIDGLGVTVAPVTQATARQVGQAYARWGKGYHPAGLNYGDCFAYAVAKEFDCALLFVGQDFTKTDLADARAG